MDILEQAELNGRGTIEHKGQSHDCSYRFVVDVRPTGRGEQTVRRHRGEIFDTSFRPEPETMESLLGATNHPSITIKGKPFFFEVIDGPDRDGRIRATLLYG